MIILKCSTLMIILKCTCNGVVAGSRTVLSQLSCTASYNNDNFGPVRPGHVFGLDVLAEDVLVNLNRNR